KIGRGTQFRHTVFVAVPIDRDKQPCRIVILRSHRLIRFRRVAHDVTVRCVAILRDARMLWKWSRLPMSVRFGEDELASAFGRTRTDCRRFQFDPNPVFRASRENCPDSGKPIAACRPLTSVALGGWNYSSPAAGAKSSRGFATPRNWCIPNDLNGPPYACAKSSVTTIGSSSAFPTVSTRLTKFTAGPITVKSSRSEAPTFP